MNTTPIFFDDFVLKYSLIFMKSIHADFTARSRNQIPARCFMFMVLKRTNNCVISLMKTMKAFAAICLFCEF